VRAGQRGRRAARAEGEGRRGLGGGRRGGAHLGCGLKVGALGDEVLEAVELAVPSRPHEGRATVLRRRGGGATRRERRRGGRGSRGGGRRGRGGGGGWGAAGGAALTLVASRSTPSATRRLRVARSPSSAALIRAASACGRSHPPFSTTQEPGGEARARGEASRGAGSGSRSAVRAGQGWGWGRGWFVGQAPQCMYRRMRRNGRRLAARA
jgi:hypothetical protein